MTAPFTIDLHVHTSRYSTCSHIEPRDVPRAAIAAGLSAVVITEHGRLWKPAELDSLRGIEPDLLVLSGVELTLEEGDFLVIGPDRWDGLLGHESGLDVIPEAQQRGAFVIWAHPFRWGEPADQFARYLRPDAIEIASSNMTEAVSARARTLAETTGLPTVTSSDAHRVAAIGSHPVTLPRPVKDEADLADCLREMF